MLCRSHSSVEEQALRRLYASQLNAERFEYISRKREIITIAARPALKLEQLSELRTSHALTLRLNWNRKEREKERLVLHDALVEPNTGLTYDQSLDQFVLTVRVREIGHEKVFSLTTEMLFDALKFVYVTFRLFSHISFVFCG